MKRRAFIKSMGLGGASVYIPSAITLSSLLNEAYAAGPNYNAINYVQPAVMPQVINIFLYGGPSELAGNLSNMIPGNGDLDAHSQVSYTSQLGNGITRLQNDNNGLISRRGFWLGAGGDAMEFLVDQGYMTVYRTMMQRRGSTQSHRDSIFMNQKGTMDLENSPGIGTRIAKVLETFVPNASSLILPFVSFEGETVLYAPDTDNPISNLSLKHVTMQARFENNNFRFNNPYIRDNNPNGPALDALVSAIDTAAATIPRFARARNSFIQRAEMETHLGDLSTSLNAALPLVTDPVDQANDFNVNSGRLVYPSNNNNNTFSNQIRAAVTLAIENPDTKFIAVSNGGLGGFDDHNNGTDNYPQRMQNLFNTLRAAMKHIKYANGTTPGGRSRSTGNIIINVFGDFGRRVNLNDSIGWDHGNCQTIYTLGGADIRPAGALGKVVGTTVRTGQTKTNNQYLVPASDSYEFEPMSLAASMYRYFGVQNTEVLTSDPIHHPGGHQPIDESVAGVPAYFPIL